MAENDSGMRRGRGPASLPLPPPQAAQGLWSAFRYSGRAVKLVWDTHRSLSIALAALTLLSGLLPAAIAWVGALIVDAVVAAIEIAKTGEPRFERVIEYVVLEAALVAALAAAGRATSLCQSLLRAQLGHRVNVMILDKALTLDLTHFEDSELYDKLQRARREASQRPLSLVMRTTEVVKNGISLVSYGVLMIQFSPWAMAILFLAGLPAFIAETRFSNKAFELFRWRSPEIRMQNYVETVIAREDYAKEVKLFALGPRLLERYRRIFRDIYGRERKLTIQREVWTLLLGLLGTAAYYGAYGWIAVATVLSRITLGEMTMYLLLFRNGQTAVSSSLSAINGMYEDNLYLSTLYDFLETPVAPRRRDGLTQGPQADDGIRFERVSFTYPGTTEPALRDIDLQIRPGQSLALVGENGSGKTTLIKLLTRLYRPSSGRILLDGLDLEEWDEAALHRRIAVIFQDYSRYQFSVGENIGAGDQQHYEDEGRWRAAADKGLATPFIDTLSAGFHTQLGRWFRDGRELSGGQWQKIALARAFMRVEADIVVLDEPTAAMDAGAEAEIFAHFRALMQNRIAILISHRFSTVRMADEIVVIENGRIIERGSHEALMQHAGRYERLFSLQARGYQ